MKRGFFRGVITGAVMGAFAGLFMKPQRKMEIKGFKNMADPEQIQKKAQHMVKGLTRRLRVK
ncbi:hypothetical protein DCCM_3364 [Desulfocucumis palustris]|uniref:YtxH domain-containing protein n=1 Tax=Desulfocucumis palustris TaxID=1898651 RepID=A0A2L2XDN7_9FIRM|nr:hypothetical protein [Desulfocucumis palustris]GBF34252.1 hypothetical protein DCCM_3364 [Desulfocucumis palustris]